MNSKQMNEKLNNFYNGGDKCYFRYPFEQMVKMIQLNGSVCFRSLMFYHYTHTMEIIAQKHNIEKRDETMFVKCIKSKKPWSIHMAEIKSCDIDDDYDIKNIPLAIKTMYEIRFDIDAKDYDNSKLNLFGSSPLFTFDKKFKSLRICNCCEKNSVCQDCWYLLGAASVTIQFLLEKIYGIQKENLLWVYSGTKGIHCWVNHSINHFVTSNFLNSLYNTITLTTDSDIFEKMGNKNENNYFKKLFDTKLHDYFKKYIVETHLFNKLKPLILEFIRCYYNILYKNIHNYWYNDDDDNNKNTNKWDYFVSLSKTTAIQVWANTNDNIKITCPPHEFIVMRLLFPIYDDNLASIKHYLKLPFSIHSSKRLSFPIEFSKIPDLKVSDQDFIDTITLNKHVCTNKDNCKIKTLMEEGKTLIDNWLQSQ